MRRAICDRPEGLELVCARLGYAFAFLTSAPSAEVAAAHPKAMPVILTEPDESQEWLTLPWAEATALQRLLPGGTLKNTISN